MMQVLITTSNLTNKQPQNVAHRSNSGIGDQINNVQCFFCTHNERMVLV